MFGGCVGWVVVCLWCVVAWITQIGAYALRTVMVSVVSV